MQHVTLNTVAMSAPIAPSIVAAFFGVIGTIIHTKKVSLPPFSNHNYHHSETNHDQINIKKFLYQSNLAQTYSTKQIIVVITKSVSHIFCPIHYM